MIFYIFACFFVPKFTFSGILLTKFQISKKEFCHRRLLTATHQSAHALRRAEGLAHATYWRQGLLMLRIGGRAYTPANQRCTLNEKIIRMFSHIEHDNLLCACYGFCQQRIRFSQIRFKI